MDKFTKTKIRAVRGKELKLFDQKYHVYTELLVNGEWIRVYMVNKDKLKWYIGETNMYPSADNMQEYLTRELKNINTLLQEGYEIVEYEKLREVIHKHFHLLDCVPTTVYL